MSTSVIEIDTVEPPDKHGRLSWQFIKHSVSGQSLRGDAAYTDADSGDGQCAVVAQPTVVFEWTVPSVCCFTAR